MSEEKGSAGVPRGRSGRDQAAPRPQPSAVTGSVRAGVVPAAFENGARDAAGQSKHQKGIASVETAGELLRILEAAGRPMALKDIARSIGTSTGAAHHYLVSLMRIGLVRQHLASSQYDLGPYALQLGLAALARIDVVDRAAETLARLRDRTGESCCLVVWGSYGPTIVHYLEGLRIVAVEMRAGYVLPLLGSASGSVFLAWEPEATVAPVLEREVGTQLRGAVRRKVALIRNQVFREGLGRTSGGVFPRVSGMASPIFQYKSRLAAVIALLGWSDEFDLTLDGPLARALREESALLSSELGGQQPPALPW